MKQKYITAIIMLCMAFTATAQRMIKLEKTDNTVVEYPLSEIRRVFFETAAPDPSGLCPNANHPHMIDLGLPSGTKWACCNVGAARPEEAGNHFAWGETQLKSEYNWSTYQYGYYNNDGNYSHLVNIGSDIAGTGFDAATANWGVPWRMPSLTQIQEMLDNTSSVWTTINGIKGRKFTAPNGGSIFLPCAGYRWDGAFYHMDSGYFWSSSLYESEPYFAYCLDVGSDGTGWYYSSYRSLGRSVRPVR